LLYILWSLSVKCRRIRQRCMWWVLGNDAIWR
jgi:hypothetical protein